MARHDPYDPHVAFDDFYGEGEQLHGHANAMDRVLRRVAARRLRVPQRVQALGCDYTPWSFEILGAEADDVPLGLPLLDSLVASFRLRAPAPKPVRIDDEESYRAFRSERRKPYVADLEARVADLEQALADHVADHHGGGRLERLEEAFQAHVAEGRGGKQAQVDDAFDQALVGGRMIPSPHPAITCWRDGDELLCTVRMRAPGGAPRLVTAATPAAAAAEELVGCAAEVLGEDEVDLGFFIPFIPIIGCSRLIGELVGCSDALVACGAPETVMLAPDFNPRVAATMALLQRCQQGDRRACTEAALLKRHERRLFKKAKKWLIEAQALKAQGRLS